MTGTNSRIHRCVPGARTPEGQIRGRLHSRILRGDVRRGGKTDDRQGRRLEQVLKRETQHVVKVIEEHVALPRGLVASWPRGLRASEILLNLLDGFFWESFKASLRMSRSVGHSSLSLTQT